MVASKERKIEAFISKQALERVKKDRFIKANKKWYNKQIDMLFLSKINRPTERIGDFNITPRGQEMKRIAWHFEIKEDTILLFIDDLLYHIAEERYVDNWNIGVRENKINLRSYGPYLPFESL